MEAILQYEINPTTWMYLSALMTMGIFFKFRRFWSVRNFDLLGLMAFSPGLLLVYHGLFEGDNALLRWGYVWIFVVSGLFLLRMIFDSMMVRRPLLEPNLSTEGLTFTCLALLVFLLFGIGVSRPLQRLDHVLSSSPVPAERVPGYSLFYYFARFPSEAIVAREGTEPDPDAEVRRGETVRAVTARMTAMMSHLAIVCGLWMVGRRHFNNNQTGVAMATLYLLLPYTAQVAGRVGHFLPGALLTWAVFFYRTPLAAGIFLSLGSALMGLPWGVIYFPLFLLPLWCAFYWRCGLVRFLLGFGVTLLFFVATLAFSSDGFGSFLTSIRAALALPSLSLEDLVGFWQYHRPMYRIPVMVAFLVLCLGMAPWPAQKNLGTLMSCSAAILIGTQFWCAFEGGLYIGWYAPLLLLTIFRPNLEDRVAVTVVDRVRTAHRPTSDG